jgi:hypothetical protein
MASRKALPIEKIVSRCSTLLYAMWTSECAMRAATKAHARRNGFVASGLR